MHAIGSNQRHSQRDHPNAPNTTRKSIPARSNFAANRDGTTPVHSNRSRTERRANTSVTVNCVDSTPATKSSTANTLITRGPSGPRSECTTTSTASDTNVFNADNGNSEPVSAN